MERIASELSALDYLFGVLLEMRESQNCEEEIYEVIHKGSLGMLALLCPLLVAMIMSGAMLFLIILKICLSLTMNMIFSILLKVGLEKS